MSKYSLYVNSLKNTPSEEEKIHLIIQHDDIYLEQLPENLIEYLYNTKILCLHTFLSYKNTVHNAKHMNVLFSFLDRVVYHKKVNPKYIQLYSLCLQDLDKFNNNTKSFYRRYYYQNELSMLLKLSEELEYKIINFLDCSKKLPLDVCKIIVNFV